MFDLSAVKIECRVVSALRMVRKDFPLLLDNKIMACNTVVYGMKLKTEPNKKIYKKKTDKNVCMFKCVECIYIHITTI